MPLPAGASVGTLPDGTLTWVDAQGNAINADGTPVAGSPTATPLTASRPNTATGALPGPQATPTVPATGGGGASTSARDAKLASLGLGTPIGSTATLDKNGKPTSANGSPWNTYTFADGSTVDVTDDGQQLSNLVKARAPAAGQTASDVAAASGILFGPSGQIYVKNPTPDDGRGAYVPSDATSAQQQLSNTKTQIDTAYTKAQTDKLNADADPNSSAQQKAAADVAYTKAQTDKLNFDNQYAQQNQLLQSNDLAAKTGLTNAQAAQVIQTTQNNAAMQPLNAADLAAKTGLTQAQTQSALQVMQQNAALAPLTQAKTQAETALTNVQTQTAQQKLGEPVMETTGTGRMYTYWDPTQQKLVTAQNPNFQPTTPGQMIQQLNQQALDQHNTLNQQVSSGNLSPDAAASQFDSWWNDNIEPQKQDIAQAQADAQAKLAQTQAYTNYYQAQAAQLPATLAETAANNAQQNYLRAIPYMANANAASLAQQALSGGKYNPAAAIQAMTFSGPSLQEIGRQGAAAALAHISPTAQSIVQQGQGAPIGQPAAGGQPFNINQMLNQSQYGFGLGGAPGGTAPVVNPATNMGGAPGSNMVPTATLSAMSGQTSMPTTMDPTQMPGYVPQPYAYAGLSGAYDAGQGWGLPGYGQ